MGIIVADHWLARYPDLARNSDFLLAVPSDPPAFAA
jgi:hypothetical protein